MDLPLHGGGQGFESPRLHSCNVPICRQNIEDKTDPLSTHGGTVVQLAVRTTNWDGELASFVQSPERNPLVAIPRCRYLTLAVGEHVRVSPRRGWRSTWRGVSAPAS